MQRLQGHWPEGWQTLALPPMEAVHASLRLGQETLDGGVRGSLGRPWSLSFTPILCGEGGISVGTSFRLMSESHYCFSWTIFWFAVTKTYQMSLCWQSGGMQRTQSEGSE